MSKIIVILNFIASMILFNALSIGIAANIHYTYDNLNRLTRVEYSDGTIIQYTYDAVGNRTVQKITPDSAPKVPSNPSPANGATNVGLSSQLSWTGGDPDSGDAVTYDVYLGKVNPPTSRVSTGQSGTTFKPASLAAGTLYYWKVVAKDQHGAQREGPVWHFKTVSQ